MWMSLVVIERAENKEKLAEVGRRARGENREDRYIPEKKPLPAELASRGLSAATAASCLSVFGPIDVHGDRLGDGIEHGGMFLGQLHQLVFFLLGNVRVDIEGHPDVPISHRNFL
jgi:hypothetical protein